MKTMVVFLSKMTLVVLLAFEDDNGSLSLDEDNGGLSFGDSNGSLSFHGQDPVHAAPGNNDNDDNNNGGPSFDDGHSFFDKALVDGLSLVGSGLPLDVGRLSCNNDNSCNTEDACNDADVS
jgi:hypothetical protein